MFPIRVPPTNLDKSVAAGIAQRTDADFEETASFLTWGADEHLLIAAAALYWVASRKGTATQRTTGNHLLALSFVTGAIPHVLKHAFDQRRPDRMTIRGHLRGVPLSGRANDAFPSGHAVHMGALASAACDFSNPAKTIAWTSAIGLSLSRIALMAHWTSDVVIGFVTGFTLDRIVRRFTGYPSERENG